MAMAHGIGSG